MTSKVELQMATYQGIIKTVALFKLYQVTFLGPVDIARHSLYTIPELIDPAGHIQ